MKRVGLLLREEPVEVEVEEEEEPGLVDEEEDGTSFVSRMM